MALSLDGNATGNAASTSATATLTTSDTDDIIVVYVCTVPTSNSPGWPVSSITDTAGLTWNRRWSPGSVGGNLGINLEIWWAHSASALTGDVITVTVPISQDIALIAFGVNGANLTAPWDVNSSLTASDYNGGSGSPSVTYSTTAANTMVLAFYGSDAVTDSAVPSGFTEIPSGFVSEGSISAIDAAYKIVSSAQTSQSVAYSYNGGTFNDRAVLVDAIVEAADSGTAGTLNAWIDGVCVPSAGPSATTAQATITASAGDVLICFVSSETGSSTPASVSSVVLDPTGANLSFAKRGSTNIGSNSPGTAIEEWFLAITSSVTAKEVKVTMGATCDGIAAACIAVTGVTTRTSEGTIYDGNGSLPGTAEGTGSATIESGNISTSAMTTLVVWGATTTNNDSGLFENNALPWGIVAACRETGGSDHMLAVGVTNYTAAQTNIRPSTGNSNSNWAFIADALVVGPSMPTVIATPVITTLEAPTQKMNVIVVPKAAVVTTLKAPTQTIDVTVIYDGPFIAHPVITTLHAPAQTADVTVDNPFQPPPPPTGKKRRLLILT